MRDAKNKDISIDPREINEEIRDWNAADAASRRTRKRKKLFPTVICSSGAPTTPVEKPFSRPMSCSSLSSNGDAHDLRVSPARDALLAQCIHVHLIAIARGSVPWIISPYYVRTNNGRYVVHGYGYSMPSLRYDAGHYLFLHYLITYLLLYYAARIRSFVDLTSEL